MTPSRSHPRACASEMNSPNNDNYTIHKVSLKRTRQACGPCRRKKARCPGEKPRCALCERLGQQCVYGAQAPTNRIRNKASADQGQDRSPEALRETNHGEAPSARRLEHIEQQLEEISGHLRGHLPQPNTLTEALSGYLPSCPDQTQQDDDAVDRQLERPDLSSRSPLSSAFIQSEVEVYLKYFHDQPYTVFDKDWLLQHANSLPSDIAFPLVALTRRLSVNSPGLAGRSISTGRFCAERAWNILSSQYQDGKTGLSFLQGTFLNTQLEFADGNAARGCASVALGLRVIQYFGLNQGKGLSDLAKTEAEARRRIAWAFFMLDRSYNASRNYSLCLSDNHFTLFFPSSSNGDSPVRSTLHGKKITQEQKVDQGIMACLVQLYALWGKATEWVFEPLATSTLPPWQTGSALSILESDWMEFETQFADKHRYMNVDFKRRAREEPDARPYLSSWLCVQFLFHSIQCLLHHPFVTMIKLRNLSCNLSATFLQKSFETSLIHSRWIVRFIKEMAEVDVQLCDPFFGYLAAIAATIQLEHTGNKNPQIALLVNSEFRTLVDFMTELSAHWESMKILVSRVNELAARHQNYGSLFYNQDGFTGALSRMPTPSNLPRMSAEDEALMWNILDLTSSSSFADGLDVTDLAPQPQEPTAKETRSPGGSFTLDTHEQSQVHGPEDPIFHDQGSSFLNGGVSQPVDGNPPSQWPFGNRVGNNPLAVVPDIPDWMIFGDFTEYL